MVLSCLTKFSWGLAFAAFAAVACMVEVGDSAAIVVGGDQHWQFGFNYTDWALKTSPFYVNDTLVFKYDPPSNGTFSHSVYLLRDRTSFDKCDIRGAKLVGGITQGGGEGFKFLLTKRKPHYFACGEHARIHCKLGLMKFLVRPLHTKTRCRRSC